MGGTTKIIHLPNRYTQEANKHIKESKKRQLMRIQRDLHKLIVQTTQVDFVSQEVDKVLQNLLNADTILSTAIYHLEDTVDFTDGR